MYVALLCIIHCMYLKSKFYENMNLDMFMSSTLIFIDWLNHVCILECMSSL